MENGTMRTQTVVLFLALTAALCLMTLGQELQLVVDGTLDFQEGLDGYSGCTDNYVMQVLPNNNVGAREYLVARGAVPFSRRWSSSITSLVRRRDRYLRMR